MVNCGVSQKPVTCQKMAWTCKIVEKLLFEMMLASVKYEVQVISKQQYIYEGYIICIM